MVRFRSLAVAAVLGLASTLAVAQGLTEVRKNTFSTATNAMSRVGVAAVGDTVGVMTNPSWSSLSGTQYWYSTDAGQTVSAPTKVGDMWEGSTQAFVMDSQGNPYVAASPQGPTGEAGNLYLQYSTDKGVTWTTNQLTAVGTVRYGAANAAFFANGDLGVSYVTDAGGGDMQYHFTRVTQASGYATNTNDTLIVDLGSQGGMNQFFGNEAAVDPSNDQFRTTTWKKDAWPPLPGQPQNRDIGVAMVAESSGATVNWYSIVNTQDYSSRYNAQLAIDGPRGDRTLPRYYVAFTHSSQVEMWYFDYDASTGALNNSTDVIVGGGAGNPANSPSIVLDPQTGNPIVGYIVGPDNNEGAATVAIFDPASSTFSSTVLDPSVGRNSSSGEYGWGPNMDIAAVQVGAKTRIYAAYGQYGGDPSDTWSPHTINGVLAVYELGGAALHPGDANGDGKVSVGDLGILAANYGATGLDLATSWSKGDFNADGNVSVGDLGILAANYGWGTIPEPMTLSLLGLGVLVLRRRH